MSMLDQVSQLNSVQVAAPAEVAAAGSAQGSFNINGYNGAVVEVSVGALGGGTVALTIEESDTGSGGWTELTGDRLNLGGKLSAVPASLSASTVYLIGITDLDGLTKPYIRVTAAVTGGTGALIGINAILSHAIHSPAGKAGADSIYIS